MVPVLSIPATSRESQLPVDEEDRVRVRDLGQDINGIKVRVRDLGHVLGGNRVRVRGLRQVMGDYRVRVRGLGYVVS